MANWFPMALKDAPQTWLMNLLHESITSWKDLCVSSSPTSCLRMSAPCTKNDLKAVRQYKGKMLH
jgi:hypothetical protein